jgi:hypothetical protein
MRGALCNRSHPRWSILDLAVPQLREGVGRSFGSHLLGTIVPALLAVWWAVFEGFRRNNEKVTTPPRRKLRRTVTTG